ncbi:MAG: histidine kinase [bacterium]|nr:histidine kinase [bacterium]
MIIISDNIRTKDRLRWQLGERVKELTALHRTALILNRSGRSPAHTLRSLAQAIARAWQFSEVAAVKITWAGKSYASKGFKKTRWSQKADIKAAPGQAGSIEVCYLKARPPAYRGPFLKEEVLLLNSLTVMVKTYLQNVVYQEHQAKAKAVLEWQIRKRTRDLTKANTDLRRELALGRRRERQIKTYQEQLKSLAEKLSTAEERERREIATDLHDHIGQGLAMIKLKLQTLQGQNANSGLGREIEEIKELSQQAIKYIRGLIFELSPLVVYELGFGAALQWLADHYWQKYKMRVVIRTAGRSRALGEDLRILLFKSVQELLINSVKHGRATRAEVAVRWLPRRLEIRVRDHGTGFGRVTNGEFQPDLKSFGLFNLKERIVQYGGQLTVNSRPGQGALVTISIATKAGVKG